MKENKEFKVGHYYKLVDDFPENPCFLSSFKGRDECWISSMNVLVDRKPRQVISAEKQRDNIGNYSVLFEGLYTKFLFHSEDFEEVNIKITNWREEVSK